ncbi:hypothetical protein Leryth_027232 [Lithospermum erythrorhizon]|nr:hypothetical protein Leryth_027232 [Lithospermum erythrorhizon]
MDLKAFSVLNGDGSEMDRGSNVRTILGSPTQGRYTKEEATMEITILDYCKYCTQTPPITILNDK